MFQSCLKVSCVIGILITMAAVFGLYYVYEVKVEGELVLDRAPGKVTIVREADSQILHISGDDWESTSYG